MRLKRATSITAEYKELESFNNWILSIGNGKSISIDTEQIRNDSDSITVQIPREFLIETTGDKIEALVRYTFLEFENKYNDPDYIKKRAILATTNEIIKEINNYMITLLPTPEREYFS